MSRFIIILITALFIAAPAQASDFSLVLGLSEITSTKGEHLLALEQVGVSRFVPLNDDWVLVPIVYFEASPGSNVWDFAGVLVAERAITDTVALDFSAIGIWDPSQGESIFFGGLGVGPTFILANNHLISPSFSVLHGAGETFLNPALAWSIPL